MVNNQTINIDKCVGCFIGLAIGDAYGAPFESGLIEQLFWRIIGKTKTGHFRYTDDTQMSIDLARSFIENKIYALGGDTDTIGAMSGAIWGAFNGYQAINQEKIKKLENAEKIITLAKQLFYLSKIS